LICLAMTVVAAALMSATFVTVWLPATVGLRSLMSLRRRSLRMRLGLWPILRTRGFHALLRLRYRPILCTRNLYARLLWLRHGPVLDARFGLTRRLMLVLRNADVRLRLDGAVLDRRSLYPRLRLPILKPRICCVGLWLGLIFDVRISSVAQIVCVRLWLRLRPVLKPRICGIGLWLWLPVFKPRIRCVRLRLRLILDVRISSVAQILSVRLRLGLRAILISRLIRIRLPIRRIVSALVHITALVHIRRVWLSGTTLGRWTHCLDSRRRCDAARVGEPMLREGLRRTTTVYSKALRAIL